MTNITEKVQELGLRGSAVGPWAVGVEVVCEDNQSSAVYLEGRRIPQRIVSDGLVQVIASSLTEARIKAVDWIKQTYKGNFTNFAFYNTRRIYSEDDVSSIGKFPLLERI